MADRSSSFLGGLLLGIALGTVAGILLAPHKGKETRRLVLNTLNSLPNANEDKVENFQFQANSFLSQAKLRVEETISRIQEALEAGRRTTLEYSSQENGQPKPPIAP